MKLNDIVADEKHGNGLLGLLIFFACCRCDGRECVFGENKAAIWERDKKLYRQFCTAVSENKNSMTVFKKFVTS